MDEKKVFKKSDNVVTREIEGKVILMPLYKSSRDLNYIYTMNDTASSAWALIDGKSSIGDIKSRLLESFDVSEERIEKELAEFIKDLKSIKAIA